MKIGIDTYSFDKPGQNFGVGPSVYVWHLLPKLFEIGSEHTFYIFCNNENFTMVPKNNNVKIIINRLPTRIRPLRIVHEQLCLPVLFSKYKLDLMHFLANNISYAIAKHSILTVHDLMWKYYLNRGEKSSKHKYFSYTVPKSIALAKEVITVSKFIAEEVQREFNKNPAHLNPILLASGKLCEPDSEAMDLLKKKYHFNFIFAITTSMPNKNLNILLEAYTILKRKKLYNGKLVVAGQSKGEYHKKTLEYINKNDDGKNIVLTGFISEEEKAFCYKNADCMVYPSLYEGFGLPVLEAMEAGIPVIASRAASIPEVGGDACLYFNPNSVEDLCEKILELKKEGLAKELIVKGKNQSTKFSWENVAKATLSVYEKIQG